MKNIVCAIAIFFTLSSLQAQDAAHPHIKDYGLKNYRSLSKRLPHTENQAWNLVCQIPYNCHFQPWIELESPGGDTIHFNSSNPLVLYLTKTEKTTTQAGKTSYEAQNWISGEGAVYRIPAGVKVISVRYRETGYNTDFAGSFTCNDEDYNVLWKKGARTAYLCMRDWFYDCPDRERVGFWGDGTPELNQCFYAFDTRSHQLCKELVLRPLDPKFYPGQQLEFLGEYGLWYYYLQTGDLASIKQAYSGAKKFLFEVYQFGKKNQWFDWGKENKDVAIIEQCFMYLDLRTLKKMALITGNGADTAAINTRMEAIQKTFDQKYWKGQFYQSSQVAEPDDRANAMAINAGLADPSKWESIYTHVLTKKTYSSCFFDRWVFEALCTMGHQEYALLRMYNRYKTMIPAPFSTLWEHYDRWWASQIDAFDDASSLNHGWNPPVINLSQTIAVITPVEAGWKTFQVLPKEAFLKTIQVTVPTVKGKIPLSIAKTDQTYTLTLNCPIHTEALVGIPKKSFSTLQQITVNGRLIWKGHFVGGAKGVSWEKEDSDYLVFRVKPGQWKFVGQGVLPTDSPKPLPLPLDTAIPLDKKDWKAYASVKDSLFLFSGDEIPIAVPAENAIDGDHWTGWRDMRHKQHPGQWFMVDLQQPTAFHKIVLDNTWALWDSPSQYAVMVSMDGKNWSTSIATGSGQLGITTISFPVQTARYIKVMQTGSSNLYHWSIYEMEVYGVGKRK